LGDFREKLGQNDLRDIFVRKKCAQRQKNAPKRRKFAKSGHTGNFCSCAAFASKRSESEAGLPDGLFFKPKIPIWVNFGGLGMENLGIY
jgi:hypothetical protein